MQWADVLEGLSGEVINKGVVGYESHSPRSEKIKKLAGPVRANIYDFSTSNAPKQRNVDPRPNPEPTQDRVVPEAAARIRNSL